MNRNDIDRMLDDLTDTQPHRSDLRQNIVEAFESLSAQLADERKHAINLLGKLEEAKLWVTNEETRARMVRVCDEERKRLGL